MIYPYSNLPLFRQLSYKDSDSSLNEGYLKRTPPSPWNLRHGHNQNYLYNGCAWIKKGLWRPEEDFFFGRFFFSSSSGPFVPDKTNLFTIWPLIPQPIHRTATARLAVDTTFTMETFINVA